MEVACGGLREDAPRWYGMLWRHVEGCRCVFTKHGVASSWLGKAHSVPGLFGLLGQRPCRGVLWLQHVVEEECRRMSCAPHARGESTRKVFAQMDKNSDGKIHCGEFAAWPQIAPSRLYLPCRWSQHAEWIWERTNPQLTVISNKNPA